jgi:hypothetical protein
MPAIAGIIEPEAFVFKSDEVIPVIAKLEVVAFEVVALSAVKFWRVDEPLTCRLESVVSPPVAVKVVPTASEPVKLAADEIVCPLTRPEVIAPELIVPVLMFPRVEFPAVRFVVKRFVELAVVAKKFVDVAKVVVPNPTESEPIVEDALTISPRVVVGARYPLPWTVRAENWEA